MMHQVLCNVSITLFISTWCIRTTQFNDIDGLCFFANCSIYAALKVSSLAMYFSQYPLSLPNVILRCKLRIIEGSRDYSCVGGEPADGTGIYAFFKPLIMLRFLYQQATISTTCVVYKIKNHL